MPTNDGTIPHRLFLLLLMCVASLSAGEQIRLTWGVALGVGLAFGGKKDAQAQASALALARLAFPERTD